MMTNLITGLVGVTMVVTFLGIMVWWVKALPLIIIMIVVGLLLLYDFLQTLRFGENYGEAREDR